MSRTVNRESQGPSFGAGFEVGQSVKDVYLKKISVKEAYYGETKYYKLVLSFLKDNKWISKSIPALPKEAFKDEKEFNNSKILVMKCLENLCYCYLPGSQIKRIMFDATGFGLTGTVDLIKKALDERVFWDTPISLKTVPLKDGSVVVGKFPPFMNKQTNSNLTLQYDRWEREQYNKWKTNKY